jgi:glycosyltransferase involved in cell wall biosynthesis
LVTGLNRNLATLLGAAVAIMNCLWITLADPEPAVTGQLIYSQGLIYSAHVAGADLCVLGLSRPERKEQPANRPGLAWRLVAERPRSRVRRLLTPVPRVAQRGDSWPMQHELRTVLAERDWDAVVLDSICAGWALPAVLRHRAGRPFPPKLVYLAHNHEALVAMHIAGESRGLRRLVRQLDALRVARLERRLVAEADLVTSNTPEDARAFSAKSATVPVAFLPPGYGGPRVAFRSIDDSLPRRAIIVGSFDWPPKRISLERFLDVATPLFARSSIGLQVVGEVERAYLDILRRRYSSVDFVGRVEDARPYMARARIGVVPDLIGGFKLKGLDYVFNRVPIMAMRVALPGMPLYDGRSIGLFDSHQALAQGVVALIDDIDALNRRQIAAFAACAPRFDWGSIGRHLLRHIRRAGRRGAVPPLTASAVAP